MERVKRLSLNSVYNIRDIGGYSINENKITKWGVFLRSGDLTEITITDRNSLFEYGIRTIINLKSIGETKNPIESDKRFNYIQIPIVDDFGTVLDTVKKYNGSFYLTIVEAFREKIKEIFISFAKHADKGGILFHCLAGRDRTGVVAALLLLLSGVSELDVLADYIITTIYLRPVADAENKPYDEIKYPLEIESVMTHLKNKYNNIENYLVSIGVPMEALNKIKSNFVLDVTNSCC